MVDVKKIIFIETDSRACILHTKDGDFRENLPIGEYEKRLAGHRFFRIHKCFIVNLDEINEILPWHNNSLALRMSGFEQKYLPVGRKNTKELKQALRISG
jgi:DNA-binding LytR/AlgR family response regulator